MIINANSYKLVGLYSSILAIIILIAVGYGLFYTFYLKPRMQVKTVVEDDGVEPITIKKSWIGIATYFVSFYIISAISQVIILIVYVAITGNVDLDVDSPDYPTILCICNLVTYIITAGLLIPLLFKEIKYDASNFSKEKKFYLKWWGLGVVLMLVLIYASNIITAVFTYGLESDGISENQKAIDRIMNSGTTNLMLMGIVTVFLAPVVEELIFRKSLFGVFKKNTILTVIISTFIFAGIHVIPECISIIIDMIKHNSNVVDLYLEFICIFGYLGQAFAMSYVYYKSKRNVIPCILIHMTNNLIAFIAQIILIINK